MHKSSVDHFATNFTGEGFLVVDMFFEGCIALQSSHDDLNMFEAADGDRNESRRECGMEALERIIEYIF